VLVAVGQENAFPGSSGQRHRVDKSGMPVVDKTTMQSTARTCSSARSAFGPKNIIWAVGARHDAAI